MSSSLVPVERMFSNTGFVSKWQTITHRVLFTHENFQFFLQWTISSVCNCVL